MFPSLFVFIAFTFPSGIACFVPIDCRVHRMQCAEGDGTATDSIRQIVFFDQANILQNLVPRNVFQDMPQIFAVKGLLYAWFIRNASNASTRPCFGANLPGTKAGIAFGHCRERILLNFIEQTQKTAFIQNNIYDS